MYELLYDGKGEDGQPFLMGLIDVEALKKNSFPMDLPQTTESLGGVDPQFGGSLGTHWGVIGGSLGGVQKRENANNSGAFINLDAKSAKKTRIGDGSNNGGAGRRLGAHKEAM